MYPYNKIPMPTKEEFTEYYSTHSRKETAEHFNCKEAIVKSWARAFNFKKDWGKSKPSREEFTEHYSNHSKKETAEYFNSSIQTIEKWIDFYDCEKEPLYDRSFPKNVNEEEFREYYQNHTLPEIAKHYKTGIKKVGRLAKKLGLAKMSYIEEYPTADELREILYGHTNQQAAEHFGFSVSTIGRLIDKYGLTKLDKDYISAYNKLEPPSIEEFEEIYNKESVIQTSKHFDVSIPTIYDPCTRKPTIFRCIRQMQSHLTQVVG